MDANEIPLNVTIFCTLGLSIIIPGAGGQISHLCTEKTHNFQFHALYGIILNPCVILWAMLVSYSCLDKLKRLLLLWTFCFMKVYLTESVLACHLEADEKTIQKWVSYIIVALSDLEGDVVSLASSLCLFDCHICCKKSHICHFLEKIKWEVTESSDERFLGLVVVMSLAKCD